MQVGREKVAFIRRRKKNQISSPSPEIFFFCQNSPEIYYNKLIISALSSCRANEAST